MEEDFLEGKFLPSWRGYGGGPWKIEFVQGALSYRRLQSKRLNLYVHYYLCRFLVRSRSEVGALKRAEFMSLVKFFPRVGDVIADDDGVIFDVPIAQSNV